MPRFRFRLQPLLDAARQEEHGLKEEFLKAQAQEREARARIEDTARLLRDWERRIRGGKHDPLAPPIGEQLRTVAALREYLAQQVQALRSAQRRTDQTRRSLQEAACRRKSLEKLRERMKQAHDAEDAARHTKSSDEIAATRAAARRVDGRHDSAMTGVSP